MRVGNPIVRIWEEVHSAYKRVANEHGLKLSDLMSIVLLYTPIFSPLVVVEGLVDNYDISREEAIDIAFDLKEEIENVIELTLPEKEKNDLNEKRVVRVMT